MAEKSILSITYLANKLSIKFAPSLLRSRLAGVWWSKTPPPTHPLQPHFSQTIMNTWRVSSSAPLWWVEKAWMGRSACGGGEICVEHEVFSVPLRLVLLFVFQPETRGFRRAAPSPVEPFSSFLSVILSKVSFFFSLFWMKVEPWCFGFCFVCFSKVQTKVPQKFPCTTHRVRFLELLLSASLFCCVFIFFSSVFFFLFLDGQSVYAISKYYSNISLVEDSKVMKITSGRVSSMTISPPADLKKNQQQQTSFYQ